MKPKTLMLLCVAVGCGLVAMIGVQQALNKPKVAAVATVNVLQALADINPGEPLTEENVGFKEIPVEGAPEDRVTTPEEFASRSPKVSVTKGDYVTKGKLNEKGVMGKSAQIPLGSRIFTFNVDETQSASNMLNPGDKVDVSVTFDVRTLKGMESKSMTLLERVDVFAVQDKTKGDRLQSGDNSKVNARQISLVVKPEEVNWLQLAQRKGQLGLVWRNPLDKAMQNTKDATEKLLADLRGLDQSDRPEVGGEKTKPVEPTPVKAPDLSSFLDASKNAIANVPTPVKLPEPVKAVPMWEVKIYKGNEIQAYPFELTDGAPKIKPAEKAVEKTSTPAKAASAAVNLLESFGWSLPAHAGSTAATPADKSTAL